MAYDNIKFTKPNMVVVDGYFFMFDEINDKVIQKVSDGDVAFEYPTSSVLLMPVLCVQYDGAYFWTMQELQDHDGIVIKKWLLDNYICKFIQEFIYENSSSYIYDSDTFSVEHYITKLTNSFSAGSSLINIDEYYNTVVDSGTVLTLGPNENGLVEDVTILSISGTDIYLDSNLLNDYQYENTVSLSKSLFLFNNYYGTSSDTGVLYRYDAHTGSYLGSDAKLEYKNILASTFKRFQNILRDTNEPVYKQYDDVYALVYVKDTNVRFRNMTDLVNLADASSVNDDFTGADGALPNNVYWGVDAGNPRIYDNRLFTSAVINGTDSVVSNYLLVGDFDVQVSGTLYDCGVPVDSSNSVFYDGFDGTFTDKWSSYSSSLDGAAYSDSKLSLKSYLNSTGGSNALSKLYFQTAGKYTLEFMWWPAPSSSWYDDDISDAQNMIDLVTVSPSYDTRTWKYRRCEEEVGTKSKLSLWLRSTKSNKINVLSRLNGTGTYLINESFYYGSSHQVKWIIDFSNYWTELYMDGVQIGSRVYWNENLLNYIGNNFRINMHWHSYLNDKYQFYDTFNVNFDDSDSDGVSSVYNFINVFVPNVYNSDYSIGGYYDTTVSGSPNYFIVSEINGIKTQSNVIDSDDNYLLRIIRNETNLSFYYKTITSGIYFSDWILLDSNFIYPNDLMLRLGIETVAMSYCSAYFDDLEYNSGRIKYPTDTISYYGTMNMDNVRTDGSTVIPVHAISIYEDNLYRLQDEATYYGTDNDWGTQYNYQISPIRSFIDFITVGVYPQIIPATGRNAATITAVVRDQYGNGVINQPVMFSDDDSVGFISNPVIYTDPFFGTGRVTTGYISGVDIRTVTIEGETTQYDQ